MRLGVSTFSFANEWLSRGYTLDSMLERAAALDLGPGLEVIGHQVWRRYPHVEREDVLAFRRLCDRLGLEPAAVSGYVDLLRRRDRPMTVDECVVQLEEQVAVSAQLGFPVIRLPVGVPPQAIERVVPVAEAAGIALATELQGPQTPDDPSLLALLELRERLGDSPAVALVLDFSIAMQAIPSTFVATVVAAGMPRHRIDEIVELWRGGAQVGELFTAIAATDAPASAQDEARSGFVRFGRQDAASWAPLVPLVAHAHAKFWELDETGREPTVDNQAIVNLLLDGGFDGVIASEWGGSAWIDVQDVDAFALVQHHHQLLRRVIEGSSARAPA